MYEKVRREPLPKRDKKVKSRFESTPEWKALKADLDRGLKAGDSCRLRFDADDWDRIGLSGEPEPGRQVAVGAKSIRLFIQKYLEAKGLDYVVHVYKSEGFDRVIVERPE